MCLFSLGQETFEDSVLSSWVIRQQRNIHSVPGTEHTQELNGCSLGVRVRLACCVPRLRNNQEECFLPAVFLVFLTPWGTGCCLGAQCLLVDKEDDLPGECEEVGLSVLLWDQTLGLLYRLLTGGVTDCCLGTRLIKTLIPCIWWEHGALRCWRREVCGEWGQTRLCPLPPLLSLRGGARGTLGPPLWLRRTHQL